MRARTPSQTVGPYFAIGLTREAQNEIVPGGAVKISGRVLDGEGEPVPDAVVEISQPGEGATLWGRCGTDAGGRFEFFTEKPVAAGGEAPTLDVMVFARGLLRHLVTRMYFPDEAEANASDPVLSSLEPHEAATLVAQPEEGALRFDIHLQGDAQTVFFAF
jgi:protocatechuate 3,4-dioxygenase, alpha subunit